MLGFGGVLSSFPNDRLKAEQGLTLEAKWFVQGTNECFNTELKTNLVHSALGESRLVNYSCLNSAKHLCHYVLSSVKPSCVSRSNWEPLLRTWNGIFAEKVVLLHQFGQLPEGTEASQTGFWVPGGKWFHFFLSLKMHVLVPQSQSARKVTQNRSNRRMAGKGYFKIQETRMCCRHFKEKKNKIT